LRGVSGLEFPDSDYFINDLEGVTTEEIEGLSDTEDHYEPRLVFDDIYNRASRLLENDVITKLRKYYRHYSEDGKGITTQIDEKVDLTMGTAYNGWLFDLGHQGINRRLTIEKIAIFLNGAVDFDIRVFDASTGEELDKITMVGATGLQEYNILKSYPFWKYRNIFIAYDDEVVDTIRTQRFVNPRGNIVTGTISNTAAVLKDSITGTDTGLMVNYTLECSVDNFVCSRLDFFKDPFLYKLGIEYCKERLHSNRINRFTLITRDRARELKDSFQEEYDSMLDNYLDDIRINEHHDCFECAKAITVKPIVP